MKLDVMGFNLVLTDMKLWKRTCSKSFLIYFRDHSHTPHDTKTQKQNAFIRYITLLSATRVKAWVYSRTHETTQN